MEGPQPWKGVEVITIGHSTRSLDALVSSLRGSHVSVLADIRTVPRSRHNPQFNGDALRSALEGRSIRYVHLPKLGGLRRPRRDSPNAVSPPRIPTCDPTDARRAAYGTGAPARTAG